MLELYYVLVLSITIYKGDSLSVQFLFFQKYHHILLINKGLAV